MQATQLLLIRHGETDWNAAGRVQGHLDIGLNARGHWQAEQVARLLASPAAGRGFDALYCSDLQRARQTLQPLARALGMPLHEDSALRERHFGSLQGLTFAEVAVRSPEDAQRWRVRDPQWQPGDGESLEQMHARVQQALNRLAQQHIGGSIVVVTHGGVLDVLYRLATGQTLQAPRTWTLANAAINRLLWTPQGLTLVGWADEHHLERPQPDASHAVIARDDATQ